MMRKFFIQLTVVFLLFSVTAQTFSSLFLWNREQVSLTEKEEQEDVQKDKEETKKQEVKDKLLTAYLIEFRSDNYSPLYTGYIHPELVTRYSDPPELPPNSI